MNICIVIFCLCKSRKIDFLRQEDQYNNYLKFREALLRYRYFAIDEYKNVLNQAVVSKEEYQHTLTMVLCKDPYFDNASCAIVERSIRLYQQQKFTVIDNLEKRKKVWGNHLHETINQLQKEQQELQKENQHLRNLCIQHQEDSQQLKAINQQLETRCADLFRRITKQESEGKANAVEEYEEDLPDTRFITWRRYDTGTDLRGYQWMQDKLDAYFQQFKTFRRTKEMKKALGLLYERYIGSEFHKLYSVRFHGAINGVKDGGIDLIAWDHKTIYLIQCKYWKNSRPIPDAILTQFYGDIAYYRLRHKTRKEIVGIFVTSKSNPSKHLLNLAEMLKIKIEYGKTISIPFPLIKLKGKSVYLPGMLKYDSIDLTKRVKTYCSAKEFMEQVRKDKNSIISILNDSRIFYHPKSN